MGARPLAKCEDTARCTAWYLVLWDTSLPERKPKDSQIALTLTLLQANAGVEEHFALFLTLELQGASPVYRGLAKLCSQESFHDPNSLFKDAQVQCIRHVQN